MAFVLRNYGNDFQYTHLRDAMMQTLFQDLKINDLEYRPANTKCSRMPPVRRAESISAGSRRGERRRAERSS